MTEGAECEENRKKRMDSLISYRVCSIYKKVNRRRIALYVLSELELYRTDKLFYFIVLYCCVVYYLFPQFFFIGERK